MVITKLCTAWCGAQEIILLSNTRWKCGHLSLLCCVWLELNKIIFEDMEGEVAAILDRVGLLSLYVSLMIHFKSIPIRAIFLFRVLTVILVVWMERNKRIFDAKNGIELEELWEGVSGHFYGPLFLTSLKIIPYPLFF